MGLDGYLFREEIGDTSFEVNSLCSGMFSDNGSDGSFRAKCYDDIVFELTGFTLYEDHTPDEVAEIAKRLREASRNQVESAIRESLYDVKISEFNALVQLFTETAEMGCQYKAWY